MANSVNNMQANTQMTQINAVRKFEPGHYVVTPPKVFVKYSVYDDINPKIDYFKELVSYNNKKAVENSSLYTKSRKNFSKIIKFILVVLMGMVVYNCRVCIKNSLKTIYNSIKNLVKK